MRFAAALLVFWAVHFSGIALCEGVPTPSVPFDAELYGLAYDVFLANSNVADAFALAEKAVAARPSDPAWRRKAAQSGEWSGHAGRALEHWYFLAVNFPDQVATQSALRLADELRDYGKLKHLLELKGMIVGSKNLSKYIEVCEALGQPEDAIKVLERLRRDKPGKYVLEELARLYDAVGRKEEAVATILDLATRYGVTAPLLLKAAYLAYGKGDIRSALEILNLGGDKIPPEESDYWATLSDLDWTLQNADSATHASRLLVDGGKGRDVDYQRLIAVSRNKNKSDAYSLAREGWQRFKTPVFFISMLEIGISLNRQRELAGIIHEMEKENLLKPLEQSAYYWTLLASVYKETGKIFDSLRCYRESLRRSPENGDIAAGYIWLLIELDRRKELREVLLAWKGRQTSKPELYAPFGAAYAYLGENGQALPMFRVRFKSMCNDPTWLSAYADILEQNNLPEAAFYERLHALQLVRNRLKDNSSTSENDTKLLKQDYARLASRVEPGDAINSLMLGIARNSEDDASRELVAAWALSTERSDFARLWYWREYVRMTQRPRWIELALALEDNDRPRISQLLKYDLERLPYRDAIEGAIRVGWSPLAETVAFERFQSNDRDYLLDQQVRDLFGGHKGGFRYNLSVLDQDGVGFLEQHLSVTTELNPSASLKVEAGNTDIRHLKSNVVGKYPSSAQSAQIGVIVRHEKGDAEIFGGMSDANYLHPMGGLSGNLKLDHRLTLDFALLTGAEANESVGLMIGGMKDEIRIGMLQGFTPRDNVMLQATGQILRDQAWNQLGEGASIEAELSHRLLFTGPDTSLRLFGGYHYYSRAGVLNENTKELTPNGNGDTSYFVPSSFTQVGVGIQVNQEARTSYIRNWRPFLSADANWNSSSTTGFHYEVGIVGPLFGLDALVGSFSQDSGTFGRSDINSRFDLRYRYYFR